MGGCLDLGRLPIRPQFGSAIVAVAPLEDLPNFVMAWQ